ncbi:hypothetical protein EJ08DRAFT_444499 [Tothia fuscella]|uniref:Uncharacterized protein n=1 Tax=Tothia fuscella TaxID=1048955 RepID=A0A9P4TTX5_9PEZI|nr:hypothetical protein EJ08DRAFT_444499 [Tothia fuscella]
MFLRSSLHRLEAAFALRNTPRATFKFAPWQSSTQFAPFSIGSTMHPMMQTHKVTFRNDVVSVSWPDRTMESKPRIFSSSTSDTHKSQMAQRAASGKATLHNDVVSLIPRVDAGNSLLIPDAVPISKLYSPGLALPIGKVGMKYANEHNSWKRLWGFLTTRKIMTKTTIAPLLTAYRRTEIWSRAIRFVWWCLWGTVKGVCYWVGVAVWGDYCFLVVI